MTAQKVHQKNVVQLLLYPILVMILLHLLLLLVRSFNPCLLIHLHVPRMNGRDLFVGALMPVLLLRLMTAMSIIVQVEASDEVIMHLFMKGLPCRNTGCPPMLWKNPMILCDLPHISQEPGYRLLTNLLNLRLSLLIDGIVL